MATPGTAPGKIPEPPNPEQPETSVGAGERASLSRLRRSKTRMRVLISLVALVVVASSLLLYRYLLAWESTDDAQIDGYIYRLVPVYPATWLAWWWTTTSTSERVPW